MVKNNVYEELTRSEEKIEGLDVEVRDHLEKNVDDQCAYCGQMFGPEEITIEKEINGRKWRFCSEECYRDFLDASNFKDEDLDSKDAVPPSSEEAGDFEDEEI